MRDMRDDLVRCAHVEGLATGAFSEPARRQTWPMAWRFNLFSGVPEGVFRGGPCLVIAPFLKIRLGTFRQVIAPSHFESPSGITERRGRAGPLFAGVAAWIKSAVPAPRVGTVRVSAAETDRSDANAIVPDAPAFVVGMGALAGEFGHAPIQSAVKFGKQSSQGGRIPRSEHDSHQPSPSDGRTSNGG
jgi:hypothetical protein